MDLKKRGVYTKNWLDSAQDRDYWERPCDFGIEHLGSISHGVSKCKKILLRRANKRWNEP